MGFLDKARKIAERGMAKANDPEMQKKAKDAAKKAMENRRRRSQTRPSHGSGRHGFGFPHGGGHDDESVSEDEMEEMVEESQEEAYEEGAEDAGGEEEEEFEEEE